MIKNGILSIVFILVLALNTRAQEGGIKDTTKLISYLSISYQFFVPGGDLSDLYGVGNSIGAAFNVKMENNFEIGVNGNFIFGDQVNQENLLHEMRTSQDQILDDNAKFSEVFFYQRGWSVGVTASKIFPKFSPNPNSGIKVGIGAGYNQHWIRIEHQENAIPQLSDEYKSYYDRKAGGIYLEQFIGYQIFSNKGLSNFSGGFAFRQGFNQNMRDYNIDDMSYVSENRVDLYFGIQVAWNILFYKRMANAYYYD